MDTLTEKHKDRVDYLLREISVAFTNCLNENIEEVITHYDDNTVTLKSINPNVTLKISLKVMKAYHHYYENDDDVRIQIRIENPTGRDRMYYEGKNDFTRKLNRVVPIIHSFFNKAIEEEL